MRSTATLLADPPLDPSGEEGRSLLRDELADPQYYSDNLVERALEWLSRWLDGLIDTATRASNLSVFVAITLALALLAGILLLVSRARRTTELARPDRPALPEERVSAAQLRERAEAALADQRYDDALVDAFRALAVRQIERDRIDDLPQATAHELAGALAAEFPTDATGIADLADTFDAVLYGHHTASTAQATAALQLDDHLGAVRR